MLSADATLKQIKKEIQANSAVLDQIYKSRSAIREQSPLRVPETVLPSGHKAFKLLAQGDSWFDYPPGTDLTDCLRDNHGHTIINIAVAGSTLNDEAYGPVPQDLFGLTSQSDSPSRIAELIHHIEKDRPQALLLSAGGNDVAGDEFFSFINNALSGLPPVNEGVLNNVVNQTFQMAYKFIINHALDAARDAKLNMPIFLHGYDYPFPDGRGVVHFLGYKVGPWFDETFNHKNYPNKSQEDLRKRRGILTIFIDAFNKMQLDLVQQFPQKVFHVDLRNTLPRHDEWANELHPKNEGFAKLAAKIDVALQTQLKA
ncbi:MAG: hypothetical protein J2P21_09400 [Chloracidobacterium sp.]|nr:hypothetical protein [Chloracidobacterium sp.]